VPADVPPTFTGYETARWPAFAVFDGEKET